MAEVSSLPASTRRDPKPIRLLSLNIFMRPPGIKNNASDHKEERLDCFISTLKQYDIVCLQEMFETLSSRKSRLKWEAFAQGMTHFSESPAPSLFSKHLIDGGLLTLSRYPITVSQFEAFHSGCEIDKVAQKGILYTKIAVGKGGVHLFNTHLQSSYDKYYSLQTKRSFLVRFDQLIQARNFISRCLALHRCDEGELVLLAGDLNIDFYGLPLDVAVYKESFPTELAFLKGDERRSEYSLAREMFSAGRNMHFEDLIDSGDASKSVKYTYADVAFNERGEKVSCESTLTSRADLLNPMRLDYMIRITTSANSDEEVRLLQDQSSAVRSCQVDPLEVCGKPFSHLSDHYGVRLELSL